MTIHISLILNKYLFHSLCCSIFTRYKKVFKINTVKPAYVVTSIKQSPVLKGHVIENFIRIELF